MDRENLEENPTPNIDAGKRSLSMRLRNSTSEKKRKTRPKRSNAQSHENEGDHEHSHDAIQLEEKHKDDLIVQMCPILVAQTEQRGGGMDEEEPMMMEKGRERTFFKVKKKQGHFSNDDILNQVIQDIFRRTSLSDGTKVYSTSQDRGMARERRDNVQSQIEEQQKDNEGNEGDEPSNRFVRRRPVSDEPEGQSQNEEIISEEKKERLRRRQIFLLDLQALKKKDVNSTILIQMIQRYKGQLERDGLDAFTPAELEKFLEGVNQLIEGLRNIRQSQEHQWRQPEMAAHVQIQNPEPLHISAPTQAVQGDLNIRENQSEPIEPIQEIQSIEQIQLASQEQRNDNARGERMSVLVLNNDDEGYVTGSENSDQKSQKEKKKKSIEKIKRQKKAGSDQNSRLPNKPGRNNERLPPVPGSGRKVPEREYNRPEVPPIGNQSLVAPRNPNDIFAQNQNQNQQRQAQSNGPQNPQSEGSMNQPRNQIDLPNTQPSTNLSENNSSFVPFSPYSQNKSLIQKAFEQSRHLIASTTNYVAISSRKQAQITQPRKEPQSQLQPNNSIEPQPQPKKSYGSQELPNPFLFPNKPGSENPSIFEPISRVTNEPIVPTFRKLQDSGSQQLKLIENLSLNQFFEKCRWNFNELRTGLLLQCEKLSSRIEENDSSFYFIRDKLAELDLYVRLETGQKQYILENIRSTEESGLVIDQPYAENMKQLIFEHFSDRSVFDSKSNIYAATNTINFMNSFNAYLAMAQINTHIQTSALNVGKTYSIDEYLNSIQHSQQNIESQLQKFTHGIQYGMGMPSYSEYTNVDGEVYRIYDHEERSSPHLRKGSSLSTCLKEYHLMCDELEEFQIQGGLKGTDSKLEKEDNVNRLENKGEPQFDATYDQTLKLENTEEMQLFEEPNEAESCFKQLYESLHSISRNLIMMNSQLETIEM